MSDFEKAGEEVAWLAARFSGLASIADELRRVGSLKLAADEAQGRLDGLRADHEALQIELTGRTANAAAELETIQRQVEAATADFREQSGKMQHEIGGLREQASTILADAAAEAARMIAEGRTAEDTLVAQAKEKAASFQPDIDAAQAKLDGLTAAIASAKATLGDMERERTAMIEKLSR